jgi:prepilin-type N-terminal cleavage/methylation domain-containing protein
MKHNHQGRRRSSHLEAGFSLIELLIVVAIIGILAAIALPKLQANLKLGRETAAIKTLGTIHTNQAQYNAMKGKFATLKELNEAQLLDANYSSGNAVSGYAYNSTEATPDKYCVQATRQAESTASKDYNVIEDGTIRYAETKTPNPIPHGEGTPISGAGAGAGTNRTGDQPTQ